MTFLHRYVPGSSADARTLVLLHGTGGDESGLLELGPMLDADANMLGVRGRSTEEGMNRFFRRYSEGLFDEADIIAQADDMAIFLAEFRKAYGVTGEFTAVGYSNGANMAAALLLLQPEALDSAVLFRGMLPLIPAVAPDLRGKRAFLSSGTSDPMAPVESASRLAEVLKGYGAAVEHQIVSGGHGLGREDVLAAGEWLVK